MNLAWASPFNQVYFTNPLNVSSDLSLSGLLGVGSLIFSSSSSLCSVSSVSESDVLLGVPRSCNILQIQPSSNQITIMRTCQIVITVMILAIPKIQ